MLRERRQRLGMSQEAFADHICMHRAYYGALERGEKNLQLSTLQRVTEGMKISMWEVLRDANV